MVDKKNIKSDVSRVAHAAAALAAAKAVDEMSKKDLFRINLTLPLDLDKILEDLSKDLNKWPG